VAPIIANGLRAYGIILLAYLTDGELAAGVDHVLYGWIFFSMVTIAIMGIGWLFHEDGPPIRTLPAASSAPATRGHILVAAAIVLGVIAIPHAYAAYLERDASTVARVSLALPSVAPPWTATTAGEWQPEFHGADATALQGYRAGDGTVELYVAYYARQGENKKLVSFTNRLASARDGEISNRSSVTLSLDGETVPAAVTEFSARGRKRVVVSLYWVDGRFVANPLQAKLLQAKAELLGGRTAAAVVALSTERSFDAGAAAVAAALVDFAHSLRHLRRSLEAVSGQ